MYMITWDYRKIIAINIYIFISIILLMLTYFSPDSLNIYIRNLAYISLIQLILNITFLKVSRIKLFSPIGLFILLLYIFTFGQIFLKGFFNYDIEFDISQIVENKVFIDSTFYSLLTISLFMVGVLLSQNRNDDEFKTTNNYHDQYINYCKPIGYTLILISAPFMFYIEINKLISAITNDYLAIFESTTTGVSFLLSMLFLPGIILLLFAYQDNKYITSLIYLFSISYKFLIMLSGQRGYSIIFIIVLSYVYYKKIKKISIRNILLILVSGFFIIVTLNALKLIRNYEDKNISLFVEAFSSALQNNILFSIFEEFGATLYTISLVFTYFPDRLDYLYGLSYIKPFLTVFPNINGVLDSIVGESWAIQLSNIVPRIGGSFIAETYVNFGRFSHIFIIILGYLLNNLSKLYEKFLYENNYLKIAVFSITLYYSILWIRGDFSPLPRNTIWPIIIIYTLLLIYRRSNKTSIVNVDKVRRNL